jgi:hypothetical protein
MSRRNKNKSRNGTRRPRKQVSASLGQSISSFCKEEGVGRATFYAWEKRGCAPEVLRPAGAHGWTRITPEAKAAWLARLTGAPVPAEPAE